jgi:hypothetical protein
MHFFVEQTYTVQIEILVHVGFWECYKTISYTATMPPTITGRQEELLLNVYLP